MTQKRIKLPAGVVAFSNGNTDLYEQFADYFNHYRAANKLFNAEGKALEYFTVDAEGKEITFAEKEARLSAALAEEISRVAQVKNVANLPLVTWASNPNISWAAFAVVNQLIDAILPSVLVDSIGMYTEIKVVGWGETAAFDVKPRDLFYVSAAGRSMGQAERVKQFNGQVVINPEMHEITVGVSLYRLLAGAESLADFAARAVRSVEAQVTVDAYSAFATAMAALPTTDANARLRIVGWSQDSFLELAEKVTAWNGGAQAALVGTQRALQNVLPDDANYRYFLTDEYATLGYMKNAFGYNAYRLPQVANWATEFAVRLDNTKLWIVSPTSQKLVKLVLEGTTLANTTAPYQNANLTQNMTLMKAWKAGIATNALAAEIDLS